MVVVCAQLFQSCVQKIYSIFYYIIVEVIFKRQMEKKRVASFEVINRK
jgi:hypothetical protein